MAWIKNLGEEDTPPKLAAAVLQHRLVEVIRDKLDERKWLVSSFWTACGFEGEGNRFMSGAGPMKIEELAAALYALGPEGFPSWEELAADIAAAICDAGSWADVDRDVRTNPPRTSEPTIARPSKHGR